MKRERVAVLTLALVLHAGALDGQQRTRTEAGARRVERVERTDGRAEARSGVERLDPIRAPGRVMPQRYDRRHVRRPSHARYRGAQSLPFYEDNGRWSRSHRRITVRMPIRLGFADRLDARDLRILLGRETVREVRAAARGLGIRGPMAGHWIARHRAAPALLLTVDGFEVALVMDRNRDGLLDELRLVRPSRGYVGDYGW